MALGLCTAEMLRPLYEADTMQMTRHSKAIAACVPTLLDASRQSLQWAQHIF